LAVPMVVALSVDVAHALVLAGARGGRSAARRLTAVRGMRFALLRIVALAARIRYSYAQSGARGPVVCLPACVPAVAGAARRARLADALRIAAGVLAAGTATIGIAGLYWDGTAGFFLHQLGQAQTSRVDWHLFFHGYVMGRDQNNFVELARAAPWSGSF